MPTTLNGPRLRNPTASAKPLATLGQGMMVDPYPDPAHPLPKPILIGAAALVVATIALVAGARHTGIGLARHDEAPLAMSRTLRFRDQPDGSLAVIELPAGDEIARVPPDTGGFMRATLRGLDRNRLQQGRSEGAPFRLAIDRDGQLWLKDLATDQSIDLRAFGPTNAEAFETLLKTHEVSR